MDGTASAMTSSRSGPQHPAHVVSAATRQRSSAGERQRGRRAPRRLCYRPPTRCVLARFAQLPTPHSDLRLTPTACGSVWDAADRHSHKCPSLFSAAPLGCGPPSHSRHTSSTRCFIRCPYTPYSYIPLNSCPTQQGVTAIRTIYSPSQHLDETERNVVVPVPAAWDPTTLRPGCRTRVST